MKSEYYDRLAESAATSQQPDNPGQEYRFDHGNGDVGFKESIMSSNTPLIDMALKCRDFFYPIFDEFSFKACGSAIIGVVSWLLGGIDLPIKALVILFLADYFLGFYCAWRFQKINSNKLWRGVGKFILYVAAIMTAYMLDIAVDGAIPGLKTPVRDFMICYLALNEFLSVSDHLAQLGMRMPPWLLSRLKAYRDQINDAEACTK